MGTIISFLHLYSSGGSEITQECKDFVRKYGKLYTGDVFLSTGGNLHAQFIAHVSSPVWHNGKRKEDKVLKEAVFKAMQQATIRKAKSVAIPSLGCGINNFPLKTGTQILSKAVKDFFKEVRDTTIMEVYLVDVKPMTVEAFVDAMKGVFDNVHQVSQGAGLESSGVQRRHTLYRPVPSPRRKRDISGNALLDIISQ